MKRLATIVPIAACMLFFVSTTARAEDKKNDVNGTWTWTQQGRQGGQDREMTLKLKTEGDKVTGTLTSPGRNGTTDTKIEHGKMSGDEVSFDVTREFQGNSRTTKYKGKVNGDSITGKVSFEGRDGQAMERDWTAKRKSDSKDAKKDDSKKS